MQIIYKLKLDNKLQKFCIENYPIEVELNTNYTAIDDKNNYDFYATDNDNKYLGVFVYNLDEYDNFSIENTLDNEIKYFENTRDKFELVNDKYIINTNDTTITTMVYLGKKGDSARTIYMFSTISFNKAEKYNIMIIQTCKEINYNKYKSEMLENLKNIRIINEEI